MSEEESDEGNPQVFIQRKPNWRSDGNFILLLRSDLKVVFKYFRP